jgi:hypothetical protein
VTHTDAIALIIGGVLLALSWDMALDISKRPNHSPHTNPLG